MGQSDEPESFQICELLQQAMEKLDMRSEHVAAAFVAHAITILDCRPLMPSKDQHSS